MDVLIILSTGGRETLLTRMQDGNLRKGEEERREETVPGKRCFLINYFTKKVLIG